MSILHRLNLAQKFIVLGVLALAMAALPTALYVQRAADDVATAKLESRGLLPLTDLQAVVKAVQQHRGLAAGVLGGNEALKAKVPEARASMGRAMEGFEASLKLAEASAAVASRWAEGKQRWTALERSVATQNISQAESWTLHVQLVSGLLALNDTLLDEFGLSLDPEADSYALIVASFVNGPALAERLGQLRGKGTGYLATGSLPADGRPALLAIHERANELFGDMHRNLGKAAAANPRLKAELGNEVDALENTLKQTLKVMDQGLLSAAELKLAPADYFREFTTTIDAVHRFNALSHQALKGLLAKRVSDQQRFELAVLGTLLVLLVAAVTIATAFVRSISGPVQEALNLANAAARGDLSVDIPVRGDNEVGQLVRALNEMKGNLVQIVGGVRHNAESLATASAQIAQGNQDLSERTEEQASSLQQTAASMEQLGSTVKQNADNARQANQLAQTASTVARKGGDVVAQVVGTMKGINESSRQIADITSVIDGIAFQTNILALNAAVEAARAGEQGRGFAVVASEVRSLAQRSAEAARQIKQLITASVGRVEAGTALVDEAGATMQEVVSSIRRVTDIMGEISSASTEQSAGVSQVGQAVSQMDQATQQNAALVEESAAAAESLQAQAQQLVQAVAIFKLPPTAGRLSA